MRGTAPEFEHYFPRFTDHAGGELTVHNPHCAALSQGEPGVRRVDHLRNLKGSSNKTETQSTQN